MILFPHTIRGRLLCWIAGLFGLVLAGFGFTAFELYKKSGEQQLDEELKRRVTLLHADWRAMVPPPPPPAGKGAKGGKGGRDRPPPAEERRPENLNFRVSLGTATLFSNEASGFYYAAWTSRGKLLVRSDNAPEELPFPEAEDLGRSYTRTRATYREMFHVNPQGERFLAGITTAGLVAAQRQFAGWLLAAGAVVLAAGLGGSWLLIRRSFRPVEEIGLAAKRIAEGALSERVRVDDPRNELGALAAVLNATFARLETAIADEKSFTANAAHELRTPLAVMLSEIQLTLAQPRSDAEYRESLEVCHEAVRQMKRLAESLLELARLDAGQELPTRDEIDLRTVASGAAQAVQPLAAAGQIALALEGGEAPVRGDFDRLRQVVINLLQNAVRYTPAGGSIRVTTAADPTHAILRVSDTGSGIAAEEAPHIFKRFYRADKSRAEGNSGLGLAICKAIVDAHQGTITVESAPGAGATFTVRIPRASAEATARPGTASPRHRP